MREAGIGRVLVASLHQGIADVLPTRLAFYEHWLNAEGLRDGTIGLGPLYAVLSFLRQEGDAYGLVTTRAGQYAAEWTVQSMRRWERAMVKGAPSLVRRHLALGLVRRLVHECYEGSRAKSKLRRGTATVDLRGSIFCTVREPVGYALCGFYAAAFKTLLDEFDVPSDARVLECRAAGGATCVVAIALHPPASVSSSP